MPSQIIPLIMCGGAGTRLWPASREGRPKQFLRLFGRYSTFQETVHRVCDQSLFGAPIIVTNGQYRFLVAEQLAEIGVAADILLEPIRRDSAPAIAAGATYAKRRGGDPVILALAADHVVADTESFRASCRSARDAAQRGYIVTFGIKPDRPAIEYGYICPGPALGEGVNTVKNFFEKPDEQTAARYIKEGYLWNSGNFMFGADTILDDYRAFEPESADAIAAAVANAGSDLGFVTLAPEPFARARARTPRAPPSFRRRSIGPMSGRGKPYGSYRKGIRPATRPRAKPYSSRRVAPTWRPTRRLLHSLASKTWW